LVTVYACVPPASAAKVIEKTMSSTASASVSTLMTYSMPGFEGGAGDHPGGRIDVEAEDGVRRVTALEDVTRR